MDRKTVGMVSSYKGLDRRDWLWKQTPHPFGVWGSMQMLATAEKPDFLLLYQFDFPQPNRSTSWLEKLCRKHKQTQIDPCSLFGDVPKERIIYLLREPPLEEITQVNKANYEAASNYCGYISGPDNFAPHPEYMPAIWYVDNTFRELNEMGVPEKNRPCCWITSGIDRTANHRKRLDFLKMLQNSDLDFDLYGRRLPSWSKSLGTVNNKWYAMAPYYYNLAIENYADNELYASEKLWDALLCWCLPIYYGGVAADKLLPEGSFLRLPSMDEKGLAYVREVTSNLDAWYEAKDKIAEARQIILHKLNLLEWLSNFVEKFS
ncbi:MAG: glycosyltransferase family 10 domain-containing protein [Xenococcaceae cyanobacterium]